MPGRSPHTEAQMLAAFQKGSEDGFALIFNRQYAPLSYFAFRMVKDKQVAEDLVQDAFVRLWNKHVNFTSMESVRAYLYITVRFTCIDYLKRRVKENGDNAQLSQQADKNILIHLIEAEYIDELYKALLILPPQCVKVIKMMYLQGMTAAEIARSLNISISTVKTQKMRGLAALKKQLGSLYILL